MASFQQEIELKGHLIDSQIMSKVWDKILELGGDFEDLEFRIGRLKEDESFARMLVKSDSKKQLDHILEEINVFGVVVSKKTAKLKEAEKSGVAPEGFYSTTNHETYVKLDGGWTKVRDLRMDCVIVIKGKKAICKKIRDIKKGDCVICGSEGVRVVPPEKPRDRGVFEFMSAVVSSEKNINLQTKKIAEEIKRAKEKGGRIVFVAGPAVVHTGAGPSLAGLIKNGWVDVLLAGNALAAHDIENALFGTSLGVDVSTGKTAKEGNKNHLMAINAVRETGSIKVAVEKGVIKKGIMYECIKNRIPFVLAGSLRDDGPLPEVVVDMNRAQEEYSKALRGADIIVMLASMLHSIAVGNMITSSVRTVCVDINPAVVTKLADRGSAHTVGLVTDVGLFLRTLARELEK
jgi:lysine-ketoglutarate reductase/saccharopine dehydrogenase-like protein (TIGR00300 family)